MSITPEGNLHQQEQEGSFNRTPVVVESRSSKISGTGLALLGILFALAIAQAGYSWYLTNKMQKSEQALVAKLGRQQELLDQLNSDLGGATERFNVLESQLDTTKGEIVNAQGELRRTRQYATQLQNLEKKHNETAASLHTELGKLQEDTRGAIGNVTTEVTGVKQNVTKTQEDLATTKTQLQRVVGDMGVQSDLIARNHDELNELRARGERDYFEFDLRKQNKTQRVGSIGLALKKTDVKRQKYTVALVSDDRNIEKKDKTVLEPVQFYQAGSRMPTEIVVNQIYKDRIVGYVSTPKKGSAKVSAAGAAPQTPQSGS
jgi:hypothetical protein